MQKKGFKKYTCKKTKILPDDRIAFLYGKIYTHANTSELAIKGEGGCVVWLSSDQFHNHFEEIKN